MGVNVSTLANGIIVATENFPTIVGSKSPDVLNVRSYIVYTVGLFSKIRDELV